MFMHSKGLLALASLLLFGLAGATSAPAQGLIGSTVTANGWFGGTSSPPGACDPQSNATCSLMDYSTPSGPTNDPLPVVPVAFVQDFLTLTTTSISANTITIVNNSAMPFCTMSLPCNDVFNGFVFTFSGGLPITNVTVDSGSSADFLPVSLKFNATSIDVNLAGDSPALDSTLVLDVTTKGNTPVIPEPSTWTLMLLGFAGLGFVGYRRMSGRGRAAHVG
jgi:PEP-CTERM motif